MNVLYGFHPIQNLLKQSPHSISILYCQKGRHDPRLEQLIDQARKQKIPIEWKEKEILTRLAHHHAHQGFVALYQNTTQSREEDLWTIVDEQKNSTFILILDGVQDPQNLGACLRTAEAAGVSCAIIPKHHSAKLTPAVHKASAGATSHIPLIQVTNLARALQKLKEFGVSIVGTSDKATKTLYEIPLETPLGIVLGGEEKGLRYLTQSLCDTVVRIPMHGQVESLNVSVATAICLFEVVRRQLNKTTHEKQI